MLTIHNQQFENKLEELRSACLKELKLPEILASMKAQVFDKIRKIGKHLVPGQKTIDLSDMQSLTHKDTPVQPV